MSQCLHLELEHGLVVIDLKPELAPRHVARIVELVQEKFYDGIKFHRVMEGFMAQTGDPTGTGSGGSGLKLEAEFSDASHVRGTCSMARAGHPDSADSQFFICFEKSTFLDKQYTVWGQVREGMEFVDQIKRGDAQSGAVDEPDIIVSLKVVDDSESGDA